MNDREYVDRGYLLGSFREEVWCICPRCGACAIAHGSSRWAMPWRPQKARLVCTRCPYTRDWSPKAWLGPVVGSVRRRCSHCGRWLSGEVQRDRLPAHGSDTIVLHCDGCGASTKATPRWAPPPPRKPLDPYFGLPLYLQTSTKSGSLWAYNPRHLAELLRFARATVRRRGFGGKWSIITRLPAWMKAARNRENVVHHLERIREKVG